MRQNTVFELTDLGLARVAGLCG